MDEAGSDSDDKPTPLHPRHRSPTFTREEVKMLINLIEKHKKILLNKSINYTACHAKEVTWGKVTKIFNSQSKHNRSIDGLKMKWDNLKREARKVSKNLIDVNHEHFDDLTCQIVTLMNYSENVPDISLPKDLDDDIIKVKETEECKDTNEDESKYWEDNDTSALHISQDDIVTKKRFRGIKRLRSINFSPQECNLLLQCVRPERRYVFSKETTFKAVKLKNRAWSRITHVFNQISPLKRSTKILQTKFSNMKCMSKRHKRSVFGSNGNEDYINLENADVDVTVEKIKAEPVFRTDDESDRDGDHNNESNDYASFNDIQSNADQSRNLGLDPLSTVLNTDSGIGSMSSEPFNFSENKEIIKLKTELLHCQLENAKLEKKRIENAIRADAELQQARSIETALRLRAARLDAIASAMKLPSDHPALHLSLEEKSAQNYLNQYQT